MPTSTRRIVPRRLQEGHLIKELTVQLFKDQDGRYVLAEQEFSIHGEGDTILEAEQVLLAGLVAARYNLGLHEDRLSPYMRRKFDFVKSLIELD